METIISTTDIKEKREKKNMHLYTFVFYVKAYVLQLTYQTYMKV